VVHVQQDATRRRRARELLLGELDECAAPVKGSTREASGAEVSAFCMSRKRHRRDEDHRVGLTT
jgi:hypothetical protein